MHLSPEYIGVICIGTPVAAFFIWSIWVTNPKHPERIEKLRKQWGVIPPQDKDLSNDRNTYPRPNRYD